MGMSAKGPTNFSPRARLTAKQGGNGVRWHAPRASQNRGVTGVAAPRFLFERSSRIASAILRHGE